jgi:hypothetical protein
MGMHVGIVAARCSVNELREAFSIAWPAFEVASSADALPDASSLWAWKESHEQFVSASEWTKENPGSYVVMFWQDGPWAAMMDPSYVLATDKEALQRLSGRLGEVLSFVVESAGGCADFMAFGNGRLRRSISNSDGDIAIEGQALPEESGIDVSSFYMDETEALWRAFGFSDLDRVPTDVGCQAVCVIDRTDYGKDALSNPFQPAVDPPQKPWWQIW